MENYNNKEINNTIEISYDDISDLEKMILENNKLNIISLLSNGNSIYNGKLCNGFFEKKYNFHPPKCIKSICYKNAIYYAMKNNLILYTTIFDIIYEILKNNLFFRIKCHCDLDDNRPEDIIGLSEKINDFFDFMMNLDCGCMEIYNYKCYYDIFYINVLPVYIYFTENLKYIIDKLNQMYKQKNNGYSIKNEYECSHKKQKLYYCPKKRTEDCNDVQFYPNLINSEIKTLKKLNCANTKISGIPDTLDCLEELDCSDTKISEIPETLDCLEELDCSDTKITEIPEKTMHECMDFSRSENCTNVQCYPETLNYLEELDCSYCDNLIKIPEIDNDILSNLIFQLNKIYEIYITNIEILKILINEQNIEYLKYNIKNDDLLNIINKIYFSQTNKEYNNLYKEFNDLNYCNKHQNQSLLTLLTSSDDQPDLLEYLIKNGASIKNNNIIVSTFNKKFYKSFKILIEYASKELLLMTEKESLFILICNNQEIKLQDKLSCIELLCEKDAIIIEDNPIEFSLNQIYSAELLKILLKYEKITDTIKLKDILMAIKKLKYIELNLLLSSCKTDDDFYTIPILTYFENTSYDDDSSIRIMEVLLKNKPNLDIKNDKEQTPLIIASNEGRTKIIKLLLDTGCNINCKDKFGNNCLIGAIKNNMYTSVYTIVANANCKFLINEPDNNGLTPLILSIYSENPIEIMSNIIDVNDIDLNYTDYYGKNILTHILENKLLNNETKEILIKMLLEKNIDILQVNTIDQKPFIIKCVEFDMYDLVIELMKYLINKEILYTNGYTLDEIINDMSNNISNKDNISINPEETNKSVPNYYPLVILYLRQKTEKIKQQKDFIKNNKIVQLYTLLLFMIISKLYYIDNISNA